MQLRVLVVPLPVLGDGDGFGQGETGLTSLTFSCRAHEQHLQVQGQVILHAHRLCKVLPGSRTSLLQQVKEQGCFFPGAGDGAQAAQGCLGHEALGSAEQPLGALAEQLHQLGTGSCNSCCHIQVIVLEWGLQGSHKGQQWAQEQEMFTHTALRGLICLSTPWPNLEFLTFTPEFRVEI